MSLFDFALSFFLLSFESKLLKNNQSYGIPRLGCVGICFFMEVFWFSMSLLTIAESETGSFLSKSII